MSKDLVPGKHRPALGNWKYSMTWKEGGDRLVFQLCFQLGQLLPLSTRGLSPDLRRSAFCQ